VERTREKEVYFSGKGYGGMRGQNSMGFVTKYKSKATETEQKSKFGSECFT
jgi:hypothetical protein